MVLLEIVTPDGKFYSDEVKMVVVRGVEGDLALMKNTAPIVTPLSIGRVLVKYEDREDRVGTINEGYVSGMGNKVTIVTDAYEWRDEIDKERAQQAKKRAEERLAKNDESIDVGRAKAALLRAVNRLRISG